MLKPQNRRNNNSAKKKKKKKKKKNQHFGICFDKNKILTRHAE